MLILYQTSDIFYQLGKSKHFSMYDLAQRFHQARIHPKYTMKTVFSTDKGHIEFLRVPFGL